MAIKVKEQAHEPTASQDLVAGLCANLRRRHHPEIPDCSPDNRRVFDYIIPFLVLEVEHVLDSTTRVLQSSPGFRAITSSRAKVELWAKMSLTQKQAVTIRMEAARFSQCWQHTVP